MVPALVPHTHRNAIAHSLCPGNPWTLDNPSISAAGEINAKHECVIDRLGRSRQEVSRKPRPIPRWPVRSLARPLVCAVHDARIVHPARVLVSALLRLDHGRVIRVACISLPSQRARLHSCLHFSAFTRTSTSHARHASCSRAFSFAFLCFSADKAKEDDQPLSPRARLASR